MYSVARDIDAVVPSLTPSQFRARFPIFQHRTYVNSCSQGALSVDVEAALAAFTDSWRSAGSPWDQWVGEVDRLRDAFAALIGAHPDEIAVMPNASVAAAAVATALPFDGARREILLDGLAFPTMAHVWLAQERRGARIVWASAPDGQSTSVEPYTAHLTERTRVAAVTHVSFRSGYRLDVPALVARAHDAGALVLLDDYQHTATAPIDVRAFGVDILITGTLKYLMGPPGIALMYVRRALIDSLEPLVTGWFGRVDPFAFQPTPLDWSASARRFETGSPPVPNAYAAVAAIGLLRQIGLDEVHRQIAALTSRFIEEAQGRGYDVITPVDPERRGALVVIRSTDAPAVVSRLAAEGIVASARGAGVRISFHAYNNDTDVDTVLAALERERSLQAK